MRELRKEGGREEGRGNDYMKEGEREKEGGKMGGREEARGNDCMKEGGGRRDEGKEGDHEGDEERGSEGGRRID